MEKGSFYRATKRIAAGLGTLVVLSSPAFAEGRGDVIDCNEGKHKSTATLEIPDGQSEVISSSLPNYIELVSRPSGGVLVHSRSDIMQAPNFYTGGTDTISAILYPLRNFKVLAQG